MPDLLGPIFEQLRHLAEALVPGAAAIKGGQWLFRFREGDIPVCQTRITYGGRGIPLLSKRIAVHPVGKGVLDIHVLEPDKAEPAQAPMQKKRK